MRNLMLALLALTLTVPALSATETRPVEPPRPEIVNAAVAEVAPGAEATMRLKEVHLQQRAAPASASAVQLGPRGGFWWVVGVIVVAGVILAVIL